METILKEKEAIQERVDSGLAEQEYYKTLADELDTLVDKNGKVKAGYKDRVDFILNELNEAYGTEYKRIDETVDKYDELRDNIYKLIDAKKAEILLNANEEEYANAIKRQTENQHKKIEAQKELTEATKAYDEKLKEIERNYGSLQNAKDKALNGGWLFAGEANKAISDLNKLKNAQDEAQSTYDNYVKAIKKDNETIILWEDLKTATITGDAKEIDEKVKAITNTYKTETGNQTATLQEQISREIDYANDRKRVWVENGIEINQEREAQLNIGVKTLTEKLTEQTKTLTDNLDEQTNIINVLSDDQIKAWKELATGSYNIYEDEISKLSPKAKEEIQNITGVVVEKTPEVERVTKQLSDDMVKSLENNFAVRTVALASIKEYMNGLSDSEQRRLLEQCGIDNVGQVMEGLKKGDLSKDVGINIIKGLKTGLQNNYWQGQTLSTAFSFASRVLGRLKSAFGIASPSKKTKQFGAYLLEGFGIGINKESDSVLKTVSSFANEVLTKFQTPIKELNQGININTKDFAVDTNQYVNYSAIKGQIQAQSQVTMNENIADRIAEAVAQSMRNAEVNVNIEAKTEEGIIFKKVQKDARAYTMRTGKPAFNY